MATVLEFYHQTNITSKGEESFYKIIGIDGGKRAKTIDELEKIINSFIESKTNLKLEIHNRICYVEDLHTTKTIRKPKLGKVEVYRVLEPKEIPVSLKKYVRKLH